MVRSSFPTFYGRSPPRGPASEYGWEETRPADGEYWRRVGELERRGGFWAYSELVRMESEPGADPLVALALSPSGYFPNLLIEGALDGTDFDGVPPHISLAFGREIPRGLYRRLVRRWGRRRLIWVGCPRVTSGATCEVSGVVADCDVNAAVRRGGRYWRRGRHMSV